MFPVTVAPLTPFFLHKVLTHRCFTARVILPKRNRRERGRFAVRKSLRTNVLQNRPDPFWGPATLLFSGYPGSFPGVTRTVREVDHSPPSSAEVKNGYSDTSTPAVCLHGVDRNNFTILKRSICSVDVA